MTEKRAQYAAQELALLRRADWKECQTNPATFIRRHITIEHPNGSVIPFSMWPFQRRTLKLMHSNNRVVVLKARRLGLSWIALAYALWMAIFHQGIRILILCKTEDDASELLDRVRRMRDRLAEDPSSMHLLSQLPEVRGQRKRPRDAVTTLGIGKSVVRALVGTGNAARSETAGLLILDEFAFQKEAGEIWSAGTQTAEGGGKVFVISTGNGSAYTTGRGAEFAKQWSRAVEGKSGFKWLFWPWDAHPDRDPDWYESKEGELGDKDRMRREYPSMPDEAFIQADVALEYSLTGIDKGIQMGKHFDHLWREGNLWPPAGNQMASGGDYGESTHLLPIWPLERGGVYIPPLEIVSAKREIGEVTADFIKVMLSFAYWWSEHRYDSAGAQSNRTFIAETEHRLGHYNPVKETGAPNTLPVAFGTHKQDCVNYQKKLFNRNARGYDTTVMVLSPENEVVNRQLKNYVIDRKEDDHGPDAVTAGIKPIAVRHRALLEEEED